MKILDITEFYSDRGGGVRSHLTAKSLAMGARGHDHLIVAPGGKDALEDLPCAGPGRRRILRLAGPAMPYDATYHLLARVDRIRALVRDERPDVLEVHSPYLAMVSALLVPRSTFRIRTFWWHADFIDTYLRVALERRVAPSVSDTLLEPFWALVRQAAARCDATFAAGGAQVRKLEAHGVARVTHLPFGVDRSIFRPEAGTAAMRAELLGDAPPNARVLLGVGRFAAEKHWDVLLDAVARLPADEPIVLALFGDGPERPQLEARGKHLRHVRFFGFERDRQRLASAMASADLLVHACPHETYGLSIAEAICTGLPVVVPDQGGASEFCAPTIGERFESGDVASCAAAIVRALHRPAADLRSAVLQYAGQLASVDDHFDQLLDHYRRLLEGQETSRSRR